MKNYFIINGASGNGRAKDIWKDLKAYLDKEGLLYEFFFTERVGHATELAKEITDTEEEVLMFVMGGDGTLNEALNGIVNFEKTYYCPLPTGSANDFVKGIGLQGNALEIMTRAINSSEVKLLDIGQVVYDGGCRRFGVSAGIGVDAYVCLQALDSKLKKVLNKINLGSATYGLLTVGDIFTMPLANAVIDADGELTSIKNCIFAAAMNCPAEGGGIPMVPYARADSGHLSAFVAHDIARAKCFSLLPFLVAGKHTNKKGFDFINFEKMSIKMDKPMCVHADGEHVGFLENVEFQCLPQILKVRGF